MGAVTVVLGANFPPPVPGGDAQDALYLVGILACVLALLGWLLWTSVNAVDTAAGCAHEWGEPFADVWGKRHRTCTRCRFQQHERTDGTWR
jgi:hypothetical protein